MFAYGYMVKGWPEALADVRRNMENPDALINWGLFRDGDRYYDDNGDAFRVTVDHEAKVVILD